MCGICGMAGNPDAEYVRRMADALAHRGPDEEGFYSDENIALGHKRLIVIDPEFSRQPIRDESGGLTLICNGEIYNFRELRKELSERGHRFSSRGDSEVILRLYQEMGDDCVDRLRGMFAFALWDAPRRRLLLARDRLGIKPLFYAERNNSLFFASELKSILALPDFPREIDPHSLGLYLSFRFVPAPETMIRGVRKLRPGSVLTFEDGRVTERRYWRLPDAEPDPSMKRPALLDELDARLSDAVGCRMVSDAPLGAYLSGGVDSSLIASYMTEASGGEPVNTFSVGFGERGFDERPHARLVAEHLGANHRELVAERATAFDELPPAIWHLDEPVADAASIPTFMMARLTKKHATVALSGEGADEIFAGYPHYRALLFAGKFGRLIPSLAPPRRIAESLRYGGSGDRAAAYAMLKAVFSPNETERLCLPRASADMSPGASLELIRAAFDAPGPDDHLARIQRFEIESWLPDDLLVKVDRMTMAFGVEARVPFLDHHLVEFMQRAPSNFKTGPLRGKLPLRELAARRLPPSVAKRRKQGFSAPAAQWMREGGLIDKLLSRESVVRRGLFDVEEVGRLTEARMNFYTRRKLWALCAFEIWCRAMLDRNPAEPPGKEIIES